MVTTAKRQRRRELSDEALEVLCLVASGYERKEIARLRHVTENAVRHVLSTAYRKIGARNAPHAVAILGLRPNAEHA